MGNHGQLTLGLGSQTCENHADVVARMAIAGAGDNHAVAGDFIIALGGLKRHGHFRPFTETRWAPELDAILVDGDRVSG